MKKAKVWDPVLETLAERGALHEQGFIEHIIAQGTAVTAIDGVAVDPKTVASTRAAMARGEAFIVQGALQVGRWNGRADVLRRVETPSRLGGWSYEVMYEARSGNQGQYGPPNIALLGPSIGNSRRSAGLSLCSYTGYELYTGRVPSSRLCRVL